MYNGSHKWLHVACEDTEIQKLEKYICDAEYLLNSTFIQNILVKSKYNEQSENYNRAFDTYQVYVIYIFIHLHHSKI